MHNKKTCFALSSALLLLLMVAVPLQAQAQTPPYQADLQTGQASPLTAPLAPDCTADPSNAFANCSFETGDFTSWVTSDIASPFVLLQVNVGGLSPGFGLFASAPTQGSFAALHGFDGAGPGDIRICQDVLLPNAALLEFDYRVGWDMTFGATLDRTFDVNVEPAGGGGTLFSQNLLTATAGTTVLDTGSLQATLDLSAAGSGARRVCFDANVPETFTGPGFFQLDNVSVSGANEADLAIDKTVNDTSPAIGDDVVFTITLTHVAGGSVAAVRVNDLLPAGTSYVSSTASQGSYNGGNGIWQAGSLSAGQVATLDITAEVTTTDPVTNTAFIAFANLPDPDLGNNTDSASLNAEAADLEVSKKVTALTNDGATITATFEVTVSNEGPSDTDDVEVTDDLSDDMTVVSSSASQGTLVAAGGDLIWSVGTLADGGSATMEVTVTVPADGDLTNLAEVTAADLPDPDSVPGDGEGDDFAAAAATPRGVPDFVPEAAATGIVDRGDRFTADLKVEKTADVETAAVGATVTWTIEVMNQGPQSTAKVIVTDDFPSCLGFVSATPDRGSFDTATLEWYVGKLKVDETVSMTVVSTVGADCEGTVTNTAEVTSSSLPDPDDLFNLFDEEPVEDEISSASFDVEANSRELTGQTFALGANYPNPFNPVTVVPFSLANTADVSIKVYDLLGRVVATLVEGTLPAGVHQAVFEASSLPTGTYLVRLEAGDIVQTQRVTLMK